MAEVKIEKWVYGGAGLARDEGRVTLVPFVLPGEDVRIEPVKTKAQLVEARASEIVTPSPDRTEPACPLFTRCGGCHYQMAPYPFQLERKVEIVREVFRRVGKLEAPPEIPILAGEPLHYRNRSQFHFHSHSLGFKAPASDKVIDVDACPISAPAVNEALKKLRALRRDKHFPRFLKEVELFTNGEETMVNVLQTENDRGVAKGFFEWLGQAIPGAAAGSINYQAAGENFRVSHKSFFQVNRFLIDQLVAAALVTAQGETALDLYSGVGLFTLPLARRFASVTAVESDPSAVRDLEFNAEAAKLSVKTHRLQSEQYLEDLATTPDFVLADPPRTGLGRGVVKHLARLGAPRITIVSCDPATLARDIAALAGSGYALDKLTLVDLFPQTFHIESVASLTRR